MTRAKGTYALLLKMGEQTELAVGALGTIEFPAGYYSYTGSAFGPGGFGRIERHRSVHTGENPTQHWHIDYLLPYTEMLGTYQAPRVDAECEITDRIPGDPIPRFGASDCSCPSHLRFTPEKHRLETALSDEFKKYQNDQ